MAKVDTTYFSTGATTRHRDTKDHENYVDYSVFEILSNIISHECLMNHKILDFINQFNYNTYMKNTRLCLLQPGVESTALQFFLASRMHSFNTM